MADAPDTIDTAFGPWHEAFRVSLRDGSDAPVPCGSCVACCSSSQFVHIAPDETDALAHIPRQLLFPAPGAPAGHVLLGYDERGRCPMLGQHGCTIYAHRPRTCRVYDCRVFAATGVAPDADQPLVATQVRRWRFVAVTPDEAATQQAARRAARFLVARADDLPPPARPRTAAQRAVAALALHDLFTDGEPEPSVVAAAIERRRG